MSGSTLCHVTHSSQRANYKTHVVFVKKASFINLDWSVFVSTPLEPTCLKVYLHTFDGIHVTYLYLDRGHITSDVVQVLLKRRTTYGRSTSGLARRQYASKLECFVALCYPQG